MPAKEWRVTRRWLETMLTAHHARPPWAWDTAAEAAPTVRVRAKVRDYELNRGTTGGIGSLLSEIFSVKVDYELLGEDGGGGGKLRTLRLLLKLPPKDPVTRAFVTEAQFHLREIKFYTEVVPELMEFQRRLLGESASCAITLPVPRCYYAWHHGMNADDEDTSSGADAGGGEDLAEGDDEEEREAPKEEDFSVLVLEDLRGSGYSVGDFSRGLTAGQASAALDAVARLHALSLAYGLLGGGEGPSEAIPSRFPFLFRATPESCRSLVGRGLPQLASFLHRHRRRPRATAHPRLLHRLLHLVRGRRDGEGDEEDTLAEADFWGGRLLFGGEEDAEGAEEGAASAGCSQHGDRQQTLATLTHSDFWSGNLLFRERPDSNVTDCMIVDWQMLSWGRPTDDAALLLLSSLPSRIRRRMSRQLLAFYWRSLLDHSISLGIDIGDEPKSGGDQRGRIRTSVSYGLCDLAGDFRRSRVLALLLVVGSVDVALGDADAEERLLDLIEDVEEGGEEECGEENGGEKDLDE